MNVTTASPTPAPRKLNPEVKKPIPAPRRKVIVSRQKSDESTSSKSSEENPKAFSKRVRSFGNASKQIAEDIGGIVQDRIESTRQSVRKISRRFSFAHKNENLERCESENVQNSIDIFSSIKFDSPMTRSSDHIYSNSEVEFNCDESTKNGRSSSTTDSESFYNAPVSIVTTSTSISGQSKNEPVVNSDVYEFVFPKQSSSSESEESPLAEDIKESNSWKFYDAIVTETDSTNISHDVAEENIYSNLNSSNHQTDLNSNFSIDVRNSLYERRNECLEIPSRTTNSVIFQFDPLFNKEQSPNDEIPNGQEYSVLEQLLQGELYGNLSSQNTIDNWSLSDSDGEEVFNPPSPPVRFDSLPEDAQPPPTPIRPDRAKTNWFSSDKDSECATVEPGERKSWLRHVRHVLPIDIARDKQKTMNSIQKPALSTRHFSHKKGMLYKVQNGPVEDLFGEYSGRWCVLENSSLVCYSDNSCENVKEHFSADCILSIQIIQNPKLRYKQDNCDLHCFKLNVTGKIRGSHIYGSRSISERRVWMQILAECLTNKFSTKFTSDYARMGWSFVKEGVSGKWFGAWMILSNRILQYAADNQSLKTIDLRKARCIALQRYQDVDNNPKTNDKGSNMLVDTVNGFVYARMWTTRETKVWCHWIKITSHNNGANLDGQQLTKNDIPVIVEKCINFIYLHGSMAKGIYRQSGVGSVVSDLLTEFRNDAWAVQMTPDKYSEHDVATALKRFFRDLPEPLLGSTFRQYLYQVSLVKNVEEKTRMYKAALDNLSPISFKTAKKLIGHLHFISTQSTKNLMTVENLASLWGPTLLHYESKSGKRLSPEEQHQNVLIVGQLISLYKYIFPEDESEIEQEKLMLQVLEKHIKSPQGAISKNAGDLRVWIYLNNKEQEFNVAIGPNKTAYEVCLELSAKCKMEVHEMILEEVVLDENLSRPVHHSEKVLDIVLKWGYWDEVDRKNNHLRISKINKYNEFMDNKALSISGAMRFANIKTKSLKFYMFEFSRSNLIQYKDLTCENKLQTWDIEDIFWYYGHEEKRNPQTKWTVTFLNKKIHPNRTKQLPFFGNIIAWADPQTRANWLGVMLHAMYPDGLAPPLLPMMT